MTAETTAETPTETGDTPFPRTRWALLWIVGFFLLQLICGTIAVKLAFPEIATAAQLQAKLADISQSGLPNIYGTAVAGALIFLLLALYLRREGRMAHIGLANWSRLSLVKTVGAGLLVIVAAMAVTTLYTNLVAPNAPLQAQTQMLIKSIPNDVFNQLILFAVIVFFAAIIEEVLFRGLLQNGLKRRVGPIWAIIISGLVFAAIHFQPLAFPVLALMGMAFGYLYHLTGSLRVTILLHMANNGAALLLS
jgi:uncharacterized protein